jgi:hypothetical protein
MAKFRIRLKLQALELEVDGERDDIPAISAAVQQQFAGLIQPAETMADGHKQLAAAGQVIDAEVGKSKSKGKRRTGGKINSDAAAAQPLEFRHDAAKYGNPQQGWNITDKSVWFLHVLKDLKVAQEVSGPQVAATFNHHFKAAGAIHPPLVTRELSKAKVKVPALVGEDRSQDPSLWYVTDEGTKYARQLIQNMLNPA